MDNNENNLNEYTEESVADELTEEKAEGQRSGRGKTIGIILGIIAGVVVLIVGVIIGITLGGGSTDEENAPHTHSFDNRWHIVKEATCTEDGERVCYCACGETQSKIIKASHTEVVDRAVEATCQSTGLTEGRHCSVCNEVLAVQTVTDLADHKYDGDKDPSCNVCGLLRDVSCKHPNTERIEGYEATCTEDGLSDGKRCLDCGEITAKQTVIRASHKVVIDEAVQATCQSTGLTEGSHCSECGAVIKSQQRTGKTNHFLYDGQYYDPEKTYYSDRKDIILFAAYGYVCGETQEGAIRCDYCEEVVFHKYVYIVHDYNKNGICTICGN